MYNLHNDEDCVRGDGRRPYKFSYLNILFSDGHEQETKVHFHVTFEDFVLFSSNEPKLFTLSNSDYSNFKL